MLARRITAHRISIMTIKAILRNGSIEPVEPLPADWAEGKELLVEDGESANAGNVEAWARELDAAVSLVAPEEHDRFRKALDDLELESKDAVRREWGLK
jgi:hypothetical protein